MNWIDVPPVFIVGCYRSGTSLLRLMLSAHSRISISGEGAYMYRIGRNLGAYGDLSLADNLEALHRDITPYLIDERWITVPPAAALVDWTSRFGSSWRSIVTFYGTWDAHAQGKRELSWWGDNAPYDVHEIPYFACLLPASKFVVMVRDPRDVYTSIKLNYKETYALEDVTALWEKALSDGLVAASSLGPSRVMQMRYEQLVTGPGEQLQRLCAFLGVEFEPGMLAYHESTAARALSTLAHHTGVVRPVFATSVGKFRQALSPDETERIVRRLRLPMRCLGYLTQSEYEAAALAASGLPVQLRDDSSTASGQQTYP